MSAWTVAPLLECFKQNMLLVEYKMAISNAHETFRLGASYKYEVS